MAPKRRPKDSEQRNKALVRDYLARQNGQTDMTHADIAAKYDISAQQLYRILKLPEMVLYLEELGKAAETELIKHMSGTSGSVADEQKRLDEERKRRALAGDKAFDLLVEIMNNKADKDGKKPFTVKQQMDAAKDLLKLTQSGAEREIFIMSEEQRRDIMFACEGTAVTIGLDLSEMGECDIENPGVKPDRRPVPEVEDTGSPVEPTRQEDTPVSVQE